MEEIRTGIVKVCRRGLNDIWVDRADGSVRMCGWANFYAGNLTEQTIEEIWHGKRAEQFRESMLDGSDIVIIPSVHIVQTMNCKTIWWNIRCLNIRDFAA